ncbi:MAG: hypothetical protein K9N52_06840 [Verrucomicrobia bacterium]|nr:hypothetical protein [Verrucomicrobiota bacterium]
MNCVKGKSGINSRLCFGKPRLKALTRKAAALITVGILMGWLYGWADSMCYPKETKAGFAYGALHGAMMPLALPGLLLGDDAQIYAGNNTGRSYKIGYIFGINAIGLLFFGIMFKKSSASHDKKSGDKDI